MSGTSKAQSCAKWIGVFLVILAPFIWIGSRYHMLVYVRSQFTCSIAYGYITIGGDGGSGSNANANQTPFWIFRPVRLIRPGLAWKFFYTPSSTTERATLGIPGWVPVLAAAIPTVIAFRRRKFAAHHCPRCKFDLAGLPPDAKCPECGGPQRKPA